MIYLEYTRTDTINFLQDVPFLDIFIKMESSNYRELLQLKALPEPSALSVEHLKPF